MMLATIILTMFYALALRSRGSGHRCIGGIGFDVDDRYAGIGKTMLTTLHTTSHQRTMRRRIPQARNAR